MLSSSNPKSRIKLLISSPACRTKRSDSERSRRSRLIKSFEIIKTFCEPVDHNRLFGGLAFNAFFLTFLKPLRRTHIFTTNCEARHQWRLPSPRSLMVIGVILLVLLRKTAWRPLGYQTFCSINPGRSHVDVAFSSISATSKGPASETTEHAKKVVVKDREQLFINTRITRSNTIPQPAYDERRIESDTRVPNLRTKIDGIIGWAWLAD